VVGITDRRVGRPLWVGYLLCALLIAMGLSVLLFARQALAASPTPACPDGYNWQRMSGVGCVQTMLPPNAKYSYESRAICIDGYVAVYAVGPNAYGSDPNITYLVECITAQQAAAKAAASAGPTGAPPYWDGSGYEEHGRTPLDELARALAAEDTVPPDPRDSGLGGLAATGVLLLAIGAAVAASSSGGLAGLAGGSAASAGSGAGGGAGGGAAADGVGVGDGGPQGGGAGRAATTIGQPGSSSGTEAAVAAWGHGPGALGILPSLSGVSVPLPRTELIAGGISIFRSMKRVTEDPNPNGYSAGDVAQLLGDAAAISALATALAPGIDMLNVASGGAAAAVDGRASRQVFEEMRRNFGRLGYMQGVIDERVSRQDKTLGDLDPASLAPAVPPPAANLGSLSTAGLKGARRYWAIRADSAFDALAWSQFELDDIDERRGNLAHQIDAISDLLGRIDESESVGLPRFLIDTITYGRGWYFAGDSSKMAAALLAGIEQTASGTAPGRHRSPAPRPSTPDAAAEAATGPIAITLAEWAAGQNLTDGRLAVLQALGGLERWRGFFDALAGSVQAEIEVLRNQADVAIAARRDLAIETQRRAIGGKAK
jgi:hypothetical protein